MLDAVCVELGGRAAELLVFGKDHVTSGAVSDLKHATQSLAEYVRYCGFADRLSRTDRTSDESDNVNTDMAPTNLAMEALLQEQYLRAQALLAQHRESLVRIAQTLHQHGELTRAQLCAWFQLDADADDGAVDPFAKMLRDFVAGQ
jgi:cell division protease FtsH